MLAAAAGPSCGSQGLELGRWDVIASGWGIYLEVEEKVLKLDSVDGCTTL